MIIKNIFILFLIHSGSRGHSPCRSPLLCPSPDSTEGRTTPKFYISKLCTANTNSSSSQSSSLSAAPSPNSSSAMEIPMDIIPNLCAKATNSDLNSDLDCSDVDFDSDSQNKQTTHDADEKSAAQKRDEACEKLKKIFFTRVSTDCSIDFKPQTITDSESNLNLADENDKSEAFMECVSSMKSDNFRIVQNLVTSTDDIKVAMKQKTQDTLDDHETVDLINVRCVPNNDRHSGGDVIAHTKITLETDPTENSD